MLVVKPYDRERAVEYAMRWAFSQNPVFGNFRGIGGNCTNFVSQCLYAGSCIMNYQKTFGWYYVSLDDRAPAWTGVDFFFRFITSNEGVGPFGKMAEPSECEIGDIIQLGREGEGYYHTLLIVGFSGADPLVAAQTDDAFNRPLSSYNFDFLRAIKIEGVRLDVPVTLDCFQSVYDGVAIIPSAPSDGIVPPIAPSGDGVQDGRILPSRDIQNESPTDM